MAPTDPRHPLANYVPRTGNRAFVSAFWKGVVAGRAGADKADCPYRDRRNWMNGVTFSRAYARYWEDGRACGVKYRVELDEWELEHG